MIRNFDEIIRRGGCWVADFRYDEGIRIREDCICPTLKANSLSTTIYLIEVTAHENNTSSKTESKKQR